ncbi:LOW QUALITY PROTEIN: uncharacterized protein LOC117545945 [Xyrichtys novacula]|uniref:LOW QUALITY PROTEIN: uncharacterized protein LOC117545945 n=1 Tax=Xyrichtys novacula TaxID=13765 RepID=A0AAV1H5D6_XYRNO|nr:LOW QUALITY PROTEIN: uncharacterized protein LOC117545945 [Xyrichtys novacula]
MHKAHKATLNNPSSTSLKQQWQVARRETQKPCGHCKINGGKVRPMKNKCMQIKMTNNFYNSTKNIYGPKNCSVTPLKTADGLTLLKDQNWILLRWAEHFDALLNQHSSTDQTILEELPEHPTINDLSQPPTFMEVRAAVHALKNNKSPGIDNIPAELLKEGGSLSIAVALQWILDGTEIFNIQRLQAKTKLSRERVLELQYAVNCALVAHSPQDLQSILAVIVKAYSRMGLSVNTTKTEVVCQWSSSTPHTLPSFTIDNTPLAITPSFKYLGSIHSEDGSIDSEIQNRIKQASAAFGLSASPPSSTAVKHGPHTADTSRPWSASSGSWASPGVIMCLRPKYLPRPTAGVLRP